MIYTTNAYLITCLTNIHVGSGGANYGVVDNLVQRDPITELPIISSPSFKGAVREYFHHLCQQGQAGITPNLIKYAFGPDDNYKKDNGDKGIGHYKFFDAQLLSLPVRSKQKPFHRTTSKETLENINHMGTMLGSASNLNLVAKDTGTDERHPKVKEGNPRIEDYQAIQTNNLPDNRILGNNVAYFHDNDFKRLSKSLPVIARNKLDNGESKNLWYEEVVPRETRFVTFISKPKNGGDQYADIFDKIFDGNHTIQIGANASIGYGFTNIRKITINE